jgi:hypothetical protein
VHYILPDILQFFLPLFTLCLCGTHANPAAPYLALQAMLHVLL